MLLAVSFRVVGEESVEDAEFCPFSFIALGALVEPLPEFDEGILPVFFKVSGGERESKCVVFKFLYHRLKHRFESRCVSCELWAGIMVKDFHGSIQVLVGLCVFCRLDRGLPAEMCVFRDYSRCA